MLCRFLCWRTSQRLKYINFSVKIPNVMSFLSTFDERLFFTGCLMGITIY